MNRVIYLDINQPKCVPHAICPQREQCARFLVAYTPGRPIKDYTVEVLFMAGRCSYCLEASKHRTAPEISRKAHEAPRGL